MASETADKFTYFDFQMYVLPGAIMLTALFFMWSIAGNDLPGLLGEGGLFASVIFILAAFVLGHLVQALAHMIVEPLVKRAFWGGQFPSQISLFNGPKLLTNTERIKYIELARSTKAATNDVAQIWESSLTVGWFRCGGLDDDRSKKGLEVAQFFFNRARRALADHEAGKRIESAEAHYQFFRGSSMALLISAAMLACEAMVLPSEQFMRPGILSIEQRAWIAAIASLGAATVFAWRLRGVGQNLVRLILSNYEVISSASDRGGK
ncbi:hypothetical protein HPC50_22110 [Corallococcus exiguus]|uniref:hypothetical protein n=1 Tax=Corallococcus TaxID=83461 RepID=UPI0011C3FF27|nr:MULTISPECIES: hypothetical protein [Corallococcus]NPC49760.1 hypothetical protein [Corallococcus exiguus]